MHRIVFDSNQLIGGHLYTPELTLLRGLAEERRVRLAVPEIVMTELSSAHQRMIEALLTTSLDENFSETKRRNARLRLVRAVPPWSSASEFLSLGDPRQAPSVPRAVKFYEEEVQRIAAREVLPTPDGAEKVAIGREVKRIRPALPDKEAGKGTRDALAWLTHLDAAKKSMSQCSIFVSADGCFIGDDGQLHQDLVRDAHSSGVTGVKFFSSIKKLIAWLATTGVESPQSLDDIVKSELFSFKLQQLLHFHDRIRIDLSIWFEDMSALPLPTLKGLSIVPEPEGHKVNRMEVAKIGDRVFGATNKLLNIEIEYPTHDSALGVHSIQQTAFTLPFAMLFAFENDELVRVDLFPAGFLTPFDIQASGAPGNH